MTGENYKAITSVVALKDLFQGIKDRGGAFGFDIETGYDGPDADKLALRTFHPNWKLVGFSFTDSEDWACYVPIAHDNSASNIDRPDIAAALLWSLLKTGKGVAHNASFELNGLSRWFMETLADHSLLGAQVRKTNGYFPILADSMIESFMSQKYHPILVGQDLKGVAKAEFGYQMAEFYDLFPEEDSDYGPATKKAKKKYVRFNTRNVIPAVISYACEDAVYCLKLHNKHYPALKDDLMFQVEMKLIPVCCEMERTGIELDWEKYEREEVKITEFISAMNEEIQSELSELTGELININLNSPVQVAEVLFNKLEMPIKEYTDTGKPSTSEPALRTLASKYPVVKRILQFKELQKLKGSYISKYLNELRYADDGRAHPNHKQTGTVTGRFSVDHVSYQQWPKPYKYELNSGLTYDLNYRDFLIPPPGYRIVGFDFSQVELRFLAGEAQERTYLQAFNEGTDVHKATASAMMGIPVAEITKDQRAKGKTLNFAVVYGSGAANIGELLQIPTSEAQELLNTYFETFSGLDAWMESYRDIGRKTKVVETAFKRKFRIWDYDEQEEWKRAKGDRMAVNAPIQGGAADYMKLGMVRVNKALKSSGYGDKIQLVMTIHDALEFYVHESVTDQEVIDLINPQVSFSNEKYMPKFPEIRADWHVGERWGSVIEIKLDANKQISGYAIEDVDESFDTYEQAKDYLNGSTTKRINGSNPDPLQEPGFEPWTAGEVWGVVSDEAPSSIELTLESMPTIEQWSKMKEYIADKPGNLTFVVRTPEGELTFDETYEIFPKDEAEFVAIFGICRLKVRYNESEQIEEKVLEGVEIG